MPMMPFIGVRISWLMCARKSLFARLALSALSSAALRSDHFLLQIARALLDQADELALAMARTPDLHLVRGQRRADEGHQRESEKPARLVEVRQQLERDGAPARSRRRRCWRQSP